jgi:hypothetical protein
LVRPINDTPVSSRTKKSMFHANSGNTTVSAIMLTSNGLSSHSAGTSASSARSENHRKFAGPYCRQ